MEVSETMRLNVTGDPVLGLWEAAEHRIVIRRSQLRASQTAGRATTGPRRPRELLVGLAPARQGSQPSSEVSVGSAPSPTGKADDKLRGR
jgi:hypothetical protein